MRNKMHQINKAFTKHNFKVYANTTVAHIDWLINELYTTQTIYKQTEW